MVTFYEPNDYRIFPCHSKFILVFFSYKSGDSYENYELEVYHNKIWTYIRAKASDIECSFRRIKAKGKVVIERREEKRLINDRDEKG